MPSERFAVQDLYNSFTRCIFKKSRHQEASAATRNPLSIERHSRIHSTSLSVISFFVRSQSLVVRGDSWPAICSCGWPPALLDINKMQPIMKTAMINKELTRLRLSPPFATGLVRRSPTVAPSGRVRMNADQNSKVRESLV